MIPDKLEHSAESGRRSERFHNVTRSLSVSRSMDRLVERQATVSGGMLHRYSKGH